MGFFTASLVSGSGMSVQRQIMDAISENLANVNTVQSDDGGPYRSKMPIVANRTISTPFSGILGGFMQQSVVYVAQIKRDTSPPRQDYDPNHPLADEKGYVKKPNINLALEMVHMIDATRAYEANVAAYNASKNMAARALQIAT